MSQPEIFVAGATGKTGSEAVRELLRRGFPVRALIHREDQRSQRLRDAGATTVLADLLSVEEMIRAMQGVQRAYFVCPWTPNQLDVALNFAVAAHENRIEHVVAMSQWLANPVHPSVATRRTWLADRMLAWLPDTTWTRINVGFFADNYMALLEPISQLGLLTLPLGQGRNAPVSNGDIGRSVAAALAQPELHAGRTYRPCGPELLDPDEIAAVFGDVLQRRVRYMDITERMFLKATRAMRLPVGLISQLNHYFAEYRAGTFAAGAPNDAVEHLTGREPEDFTTIVRRYVGAGVEESGFLPAVGGAPSCERSVGNRVRALVNFARLLLTPAPDLVRFEHEQEFPRIADARTALRHEPWKRKHLVRGAYGSNQRSGSSDVLASP